MPHLSLMLLGSFRALVDGEPVTRFESDKVRALLAYLAVEADRPHRRQALAGLLWPEQPERVARHDLSQALFNLRQSIQDRDATPPFLLITRETIQFDTNSDHRLDVATFSNLLAACEQHRHSRLAACDLCLDRLQRAVALYRGCFLAGFSLRDSISFEEWSWLQQERLQRLALSALQRLARCHEQRGELDLALRYAWRQVELDPLLEEAHRQLMRLLALAGRHSEALAQYETCRRLLAAEWQSQPAPETTALYQAIRDRIFPSLATGQPAGRGPLTPSPTLPVSLSPTHPLPPSPFVARERELAQLNAHLDLALAGQGRVVFVTGGAGWGKTALLQAFARRSQQAYALSSTGQGRTLIVAGGNCSAYTGISDPYLPFREILDLLSGDIEAGRAVETISQEQACRLAAMLPLVVQALVQEGPDLIGTFVSGAALLARAAAYARHEKSWASAGALRRLRALVAEKAARRPSDPGMAADSSAEGARQTALFYQYTRVLQALARQAPLVLLLDDLQWADLGSISLLFHLGRRLTGSRILIVGAYRPEEIMTDRGGKRHPLQPIVHEFQRIFGDILVELGRTRDREFVDAFLDSEPNRLDASFRDTLFRLTGGHPLFTIELLRGMIERGDIVQDRSGRWVATGTLAWETLPARVEAAIAGRIVRLPAALQAALTVASVEGEEFSAEVVGRVEAISEREMVQQLSNVLEKRYRLVRAQGVRRVDSRSLSRYRFRHYLFQKYLYGRLDEVERAHLHEEVGNALEALYGDQAGQIAVQLSRHFQEAGIADKAIGYLVQAGDRARQLCACQEALGHFHKALALAHGGERHREILARRGQVLLDLFKGAEAAADFEQLLERARQDGNRAAELQALLGLAQAYLIMAYDRPEFASRSRELLEQAYPLARELGDRVAMVRSLVSRVEFCSFWPDYRDEAASCAEQALALSQELGHPGLIADSTLARARLQRFDEAEVQLVALAGRLQDRHDLVRLKEVYFRLITVCSYQGKFEQCVEYCDAAIGLAEQIGVLPVQYPSFKAMALTYLGRFDEAWEALQAEVTDEAHRLASAFKDLATGIYLGEVLAYEQACRIFRNLVEQGKALGRPWLRGWALQELTRAFFRAECLDPANAAFLAQEFPARDRSLPAIMAAYIALAHGRRDEALQQLERMGAEAVAKHMRDWHVLALELQLTLLQRLGRPGAVVALADQALALAEEGHYLPATWRIRAAKAQALALLGEAQAALGEYQAAAGVIHQLADRIPDKALGRGFLSDPLVASTIAAAPGGTQHATSSRHSRTSRHVGRENPAYPGPG